jgi:hypothetical protein
VIHGETAMVASMVTAMDNPISEMSSTRMELNGRIPMAMVSVTTGETLRGTSREPLIGRANTLLVPSNLTPVHWITTMMVFPIQPSEAMVHSMIVC